MEHRKSQSSLEEHLLDPDAGAPERPSPQPLSVSHGRVAFPPTPPKRFPMRTLVLIFIPLIVTGYYYFIWQYFLLRDFDEAVKYGLSTEIWVYYAWFIIGVLCLDWSRHGLVGVEAAMLQSSWFHLPHLVGLMSHGESTWSGPGGWMRCFKRFANSRDARGGWFGRLLVSLRTYKLWYILAFLSLSVYVGLPLSGLTMGLSDGYVRLDERPMVVGRTQEDFSDREYSKHYGPMIKSMWRIGSPAILPGVGIIYTPRDLKRDEYPGLREIPNTLPTGSEIPDMFLSPQARVPVSGKAWGLRAGYNCSIVGDISEFTLLTQKRSNNCSTTTDGTPCISTRMEQSVDGQNVWAYLEIGVPSLKQTEYDGEEEFSLDPAGTSRPQIIEYALWQVRRNASYNQNGDFNSTIKPTIRGMPSPFMKADNGSWIANLTYFDTGNTDNQTKANIIAKLYDGMVPGKELSTIETAPPIGVRCIVTSALGTAELEPGTSTFHSFEQVAPVPWTKVEAEGPLPFLGYYVREIMSQEYLNIFTSVNSRDVRPHSNSVSYAGFIHPQDLRKSFMLAYGMEALQMMYDGRYGFEGSWLSNLTSSKKGKILTKGELPPWVSVLPFGIWTAGCLILAVCYGFRKRWVESLDGFSFFRFGIYLAADVNPSSKLFNSTEAYEVEGLWNLPGEVGK